VRRRAGHAAGERDDDDAPCHRDDGTEHDHDHCGDGDGIEPAAGVDVGPAAIERPD
jgi:hypothetical protein